MTLEYILKLGLKSYFTNFGAQKIDGSIVKTFKMVLPSFQIQDKLKRAQFFQKTSLLTNFSIEVVLKMLFLIFSNGNI